MNPPSRPPAAPPVVSARSLTASSTTACRHQNSGRTCTTTCRSCSSRRSSTWSRSCWTRRPPRVRPTPPAALQPRHVQLRGSGRARQPHRPVADRGHGPGPREPGAAARRQFVGMALCWLAVVKAGMVAVATMPLLRARELGDIIDKAQPALALCDATLLAELKYAQQEHPALRTIQKFNAADDPGRPGRPVRRQVRVFAALPDGRRRHRADGVHIGHHRQAQGRHSHPPRRDSPPANAGRATCCAPRPTTSSWARRRWPSPSAWAAC
jgi:acyl-CoA synthetase (AMP-forming)/AMP-acid ligase II